MRALESSGVHSQVWPIKSEQMPRWIKQRLLQSGIDASKEAVEILSERVEGNLLAAVQELSLIHI